MKNRLYISLNLEAAKMSVSGIVCKGVKYNEIGGLEPLSPPKIKTIPL